MGSYLMVSRGRDPAATAVSEHLRQLARSNGLAVAELNPCVWLAVGGPRPPSTLAVGPWTLIGDVFNRVSPDLPVTCDDDPHAYERKLLARFWGRFIGARCSGDGAVSHLLRDPSGALPCITWTQHGLTLAASGMPDWLLQRLRPPWQINFHRLAAALQDPLSAPGDLPLDGPLEVYPGTDGGTALIVKVPPPCSGLPWMKPSTAWRPLRHPSPQKSPGASTRASSPQAWFSGTGTA